MGLAPPPPPLHPETAARLGVSGPPPPPAPPSSAADYQVPALPEGCLATDDVVPPFTLKELDGALARLRHDAAVGADHLSAELLKTPDPAVRDLLLAFCNRVLLSDEPPPAEWQTAIRVMLYKKGSAADPGNYRGVCLQSAALKVFMRMMLHRLRAALDPHLGESQMGFRRARYKCHGCVCRTPVDGGGASPLP